MAKYKVGDKVRVIGEFDDDTRYYMDDKADFWYATDNIMESAGKVVVIKEFGYKQDGRIRYYLCEGFDDGDDWWTCEMFEGLAEEEPTMKFKVGDRVKVIKVVDYKDNILNELGTVIFVNEQSTCPYLVEFDNNVAGHDGLYDEVTGKDGHCWWCNDESLVYTPFEKPEPKSEPTVVVNINVTINNYDNACWYCREGGIVDLYFGGRPGICPKCGRVCNTVTQDTNTPKGHKPPNPFNGVNTPLTNEELDRLPEGTRVFVVKVLNGVEQMKDKFTCWRTLSFSKRSRKSLERNGGWCAVGECNRDDEEHSYHVYLYKPEDAVDSGQ